MVITLLILFIGFSLINILFYIGYFSFAAAKKSTPKQLTELPKVSVIVCAKNEAENLQQFIPSILNQKYHDFEVILINDASVDDTLEVMENFRDNDPRVKIVNVENNEAFWGKKKYALTLGIKKASNSHLLFTDADCVPASENWIEHMVQNFQEEKSIVLGYGGYFKKNFSFVNKLIRFETLFTAIQYFSYAQWGKPYMGVGRNLAYTSQEFYAQNGFATHLHVRSGDDDLFVNQAATKSNTALCYDPEGITRSVPKTSLKSWYHQKRRHVSTAKHYKLNDKLLLSTFYISQVGFWVLAIILLAFQIQWEVVLAVVMLRLLVQHIVFYKSAKKLDELDLLWMLPILELFLIFFQFGIFSANIFSKPSTWK
jgi:glycosyltransferase involved in cell wall biosynthesis